MSHSHAGRPQAQGRGESRRQDAARAAARVYRWNLRDARSAPARRAFTLIELLVVVAIIALLSGMSMSMISTARRSGQRINTESTMRTVHAALRMFQRDIGVMPYQSYAAGTGVTPALPATNLLARRLGHTMDASERADLNLAVSAAAGKYAYNCDLSGNGTELSPQPSALTCRKAWAADITAAGAVANRDRANDVELAYLINRLSMQRARLAVQAGALDLPGPLITKPGGSAAVADLTGTPLLQSSDGVAASVVGWCDDYLDGALDRRHVSGDDILDAYGRPLVVISQVLPKVQFSNVQIGYGSIGGFDSSWFGLGVSGFRPGTGPWSSIVAAKRWRLLSMGRIRLSPGDAGDGQPTPADATCLPDAAALLASDRRYYAAPGFEADCELWSAGPSGTLSWMRNAAANRNAVPFVNYDRGLR